VVVDRYLERKRASLKPKSFAEATRYLRTLASPLAKLGLAQIDRRKIAVLLGEIEDGSGAVTRNRARSALSAFFSWCITEGLFDVNPVAGTAKASENGGRERVLTREELRKLWRSLGDDPFSDIVRLLLLTGQRRTEIGGLRWSEVDLARKMIVLPPDRTKNGRQHELPLSRQALAVLERQPRRNSTEFVFSDNGNQDWDRSKARLDGKVGIAPWRLHDLRRTCSTMLGELGVLPHVIEQALNHVSGAKAGVAGVYNRSKMIDAVRSSLQTWADEIDRITK
jgi:integrase